MKQELKLYIDKYLNKKNFAFRAKVNKDIIIEEVSTAYMHETSFLNVNINEYINDNVNYESKFKNLLFKFIDERNLKDSDVYNKVHIDRRLFSKIRSDNTYHPSKDTVILLALALELNENDMEKLLDSSSYSLPKNNYYDLIIRFCFINKIYDVMKVNELLDEYKCKLFV